MTFLRGDVVISSIGGKNGRTRPWVVVQTNLLNEFLFTILVAPLTSEVKIEQEDFRPILRPSVDNGVKQISQVMLDRLTVMDNKEIIKKIGMLNKKDILHINQAMAFVLGL